MAACTPSFALIGEHARPGVTTSELDAIAEEFIQSQGGAPTFKGYRGYPAAICTSPNRPTRMGRPFTDRLTAADPKMYDAHLGLGVVERSTDSFDSTPISFPSRNY